MKETGAKRIQEWLEILPHWRPISHRRRFENWRNLWGTGSKLQSRPLMWKERRKQSTTNERLVLGSSVRVLGFAFCALKSFIFFYLLLFFIFYFLYFLSWGKYKYLYLIYYKEFINSYNILFYFIMWFYFYEIYISTEVL